MFILIYWLIYFYAVAALMDSQEAKLYDSLLIVVGVVGIILFYYIITIIRYQRRSLRMNKEKIQAEIDTLEKERKKGSLLTSMMSWGRFCRPLNFRSIAWTRIVPMTCMSSRSLTPTLIP